MPIRALETLPDHSRLWLIALAEAPGGARLQRLAEGMDQLVEAWRHKGQAYLGAWALLDGQILAVAEPTMASAPSGCAIDGFFRRVARLQEALRLPAHPGDAVIVRDDEGIRAVPRTSLDVEIAQGRLTAETLVADLALYDLGQLRRAGLWKPLRATWIARKHLSSGRSGAA